jgi:N-acetylmuramoyl-L-alanine amidase
VIYPHQDAVIETRDSNFILGSVGTGDARLTINGFSVPVRANGAFLAWLPVPDSASSRYDLVAVAGTDTARLSYPVKLLPSRLALEDSAIADSIAAMRRPFPDSGHFVVLDSRDSTLPDTDRVVIARPIPGGTYKWFLLPGTVVQVTGRTPTFERVKLDTALEVWVSPRDIRGLAPPAPPPRAVPIANAVGPRSATARAKHAGPSPASSRTTDGKAAANRRHTPPGHAPPSPVPPSAHGSTGSPAATACASCVTPAAPAERVPHRVIGAVRVVPARDWDDVVFTMGERPPYLIEENGSDLDVTFYGTQASTDLIQYVGRDASGVPDTLVRSVTWTQVTSDRARYTVHLTEQPFGYLVLWTGSGFVLRVRRTPVVDPASPLHGLTIAIDPGHPPAGSTGPTGLYEGVATLAIARRLDSLLVARGATVVMTRTTDDPVALGARPVMSRRVGADAFVSIHLNALPDGMNPFNAHGTGTYFFHPHSIALARAAETGLVRQLGLRDLGVHYDNLAVVRQTWMPAILCEGAFVIIPEQEAALRTPEFQGAYARGVADGLESYFRTLAGKTPMTTSGAQPVASSTAPRPDTTGTRK